MKIKTVLLLLAACASWPVEAQPLGSDVPGLLNYAKAHNHELAAARYEADAASMRVAPAGSLPDPVLRTELLDITNQGTNKPPGFLPSKVGGTRYLLMQSVPWFGKLALQSELAGAQVAGARGQSAATWADLASQIKSAYAMHYFLSDNSRLTRATFDRTSELEKIAQARYASGLGTQQEVIRAQIEKTELQSTLIELGNEQHHVHARLNFLLSRPEDAELADPLLPRSLPAKLQFTALNAMLRANNPQLQVAQSRVSEAQKRLELSYKNSYPGFTLGVAPTQSGNTVKSWDMMVEFNIPLQQAQRRSQEGEAQAGLSAENERAASLLDRMLSELSESVSGLERAQHTAELITTRLLPQVQLSFDSALNGYTNGRVDFSTLLDARRQILKAQLQRIKSQYDAQLRLAEIERLIGEEL